jgi:hypothetical protein
MPTYGRFEPHPKKPGHCLDVHSEINQLFKIIPALLQWKPMAGNNPQMLMQK